MDEILASIRRIIETGEDRNGAPNAGLASARLQRAPYAFGIAPASLQSDLPTARAPAEFPADAEDVARVEGAALSSSVAVTAPGERSEEDDDRLTAALETELAASWGSFEVVPPTVAAPMREPAPSFVDAPEPVYDDAAAAVEVSANADSAARDQSRETAPEFADTHDGDGNGDVTPEAGFASFDAPAHETPILQDQSAMGTESTLSDRGVFEPANTDERDRRAAAGPESTFYAPIHDTSASPLASDMTGNLVAASFDELAQAIRNGELKSLESMAQEMLRPMLQEWLDDNLPRMVERLVREEIERMARGGRR